MFRNSVVSHQRNKKSASKKTPMTCLVKKFFNNFRKCLVLSVWDEWFLPEAEMLILEPFNVQQVVLKSINYIKYWMKIQQSYYF